MQHSINFNLNLIDKDDTFSPDPVSENTTSVDESMKMAYVGMRREHDQRTGETAALDQRVTALELKKIVVGHYVGTGGRQPIDLGFTPIAVLLHGNGDTALAVTGYITGGAEITETGFVAREDGTQNLNTQSRQYNYIAFG